MKATILYIGYVSLFFINANAIDNDLQLEKAQVENIRRLAPRADRPQIPHVASAPGRLNVPRTESQVSLPNGEARSQPQPVADQAANLDSTRRPKNQRSSSPGMVEEAGRPASRQRTSAAHGQRSPRINVSSPKGGKSNLSGNRRGASGTPRLALQQQAAQIPLRDVSLVRTARTSPSRSSRQNDAGLRSINSAPHIGALTRSESDLSLHRSVSPGSRMTPPSIASHSPQMTSSEEETESSSAMLHSSHRSTASSRRAHDGKVIAVGNAKSWIGTEALHNDRLQSIIKPGSEQRLNAQDPVRATARAQIASPQGFARTKAVGNGILSAAVVTGPTGSACVQCELPGHSPIDIRIGQSSRADIAFRNQLPDEGFAAIKAKLRGQGLIEVAADNRLRRRDMYMLSYGINYYR